MEDINISDDSLKPWDFVICGIGSVGWRQLELLVKEPGHLTVIDPDPDRRREASARWGRRLELLSSADEFKIGRRSNVIFVISNWGPDHWKTIQTLMESGGEIFYCEKPLTTSLESLSALKALVVSGRLRLLTGLNRTYMGFAERLNSIESMYHLGSPSSMVVHGGAQDLATNGIHWLDLAADLFQDYPSEVMALARTQCINPRSSQLEFWEGSACWKFGDQFLTISYSNASSVANEAIIYYRNARVRVSTSTDWSLEIRPDDEVAGDPRVTRVGHANTIAVSGTTSSIQEAFLTKIELLKSLQVNLADKSLHEIQIHEALLGLFCSAASGATVKLPVPKDDPLFTRVWNIS